MIFFNLSLFLYIDGDGIPNYADEDMDGNGVLDYLEDYDHDGIPDYLDDGFSILFMYHFFVSIFPQTWTVTVFSIP